MEKTHTVSITFVGITWLVLSLDNKGFMKKGILKKSLCMLGLFLMLWSANGPAQDSQSSSKESQVSKAENVVPGESSQVKVIADFEREGQKIWNNLGGESGDWNYNPEDINNSYTDPKVISVTGIDGKQSRVLSLTYSVDSSFPARNGFWTKLMGFDASSYDHLEFEIKGDTQRGFTDRFRLEMKKCVDKACIEKVTGSAVVPVTGEWRTVSIPLNQMTGLIDFANPECWKNPRTSYKPLDELVIIFRDQLVTKKAGRIYLDNIRFVRTGKPGPSAVDFPIRLKEKTPIRLEGLAYQKFLVARLRGFPTEVLVKKKFPSDDKAFLKEIARDTWHFFDDVIDKEHALPLDTIKVGDKQPLDAGTWIGDYTNVTNIGVYLMALVSAYDMGFITKEESVKRIRATLDTVANKMEYHSSGFPYNYYDTTMLDHTSYFVSFVDSGWFMLGLYVAKNAFPEELAGQTTRLLKRGNLSFFYDPNEKQMYHGYYDNLKSYSDYHYGIFYTEARAVSYMSVARGDVPANHWFEGLVRTFPVNYGWQTQPPKNRIEKKILGYTTIGGYYEWKDLKYVPSWGGSAFEALMPTMVLNEKELASNSLGKNNAVHVQGQIRFALEELGQPVWGMSPSSVPEGGYSEYGAKPFGIKGYKSGVVTPHASVLALEYAPEKVVANLRKLIELYDIYGEYGFYDSVTVATGKVIRKYLALDQAMIFVSINNYLNHGAIRNRFHADPEMKNGEKYLSAERFFDEAPEATAKK